MQNALCRVFLFRLSLFVHIHFVNCLLKARSEIKLALTPSKAIWVDKPEHALEVNEIIGLIPGFLSQTSLCIFQTGRWFMKLNPGLYCYFIKLTLGDQIKTLSTFSSTNNELFPFSLNSSLHHILQGSSYSKGEVLSATIFRFQIVYEGQAIRNNTALLEHCIPIYKYIPLPGTDIAPVFSKPVVLSLLYLCF